MTISEAGTQSTDHRQTWDLYTQSWRAETDTERQALFAQALAKECCYLDPITERRNWESLTEYMNEFHRQVPGGHFVTKKFWAHQGRSAALWEMCDARGEKFGDGVSYGEYDEQGKLVSMTGFFDLPG